MSAARRRHYKDRRQSWRGWRERSAENGALPCAANGCGYRRQALGSLCETHRRRLERTGHHLVERSVHLSEWKPLVETAAQFVAAQLAANPPHPSIAAAVSWCDEELARARRWVDVPRRRGSDHAAFDSAARLRRVSSRGLDGRELLARFIAAHLMDDRGLEARPRIRSDGHFLHQAGRLILHRALIGRTPWKRQRPFKLPQPHIDNYHDPNVRTRRYAFRRVNSAVGVVALAAAEAIRAQQNHHANHSTTTTKDHPS